MKTTILAITSLVAALTMSMVTLNTPNCVNGLTLFPAQYWVGLENGLTNDTLGTHCVQIKEKKVVGIQDNLPVVEMVNPNDNLVDLGVRDLPVHGYFNWTFKTRYWSKTIYVCNFTWPNHGHKTMMQVFKDHEDYVDDLCGRHCYWKVQDDGFYLYDNINGKGYGKRDDWYDNNIN